MCLHKITHQPCIQRAYRMRKRCITVGGSTSPTSLTKSTGLQPAHKMRRRLQKKVQVQIELTDSLQVCFIYRKQPRIPANLTQRAPPHPGKRSPHILRQIGKHLHHMVLSPLVLRLKFRIMRRNPARTRILLTNPRHNASLCNQQQLPKIKLLGTKKRRDHNIPPTRQPTVRPQNHPVPQRILCQRLMHLQKPDLPRKPRMLHRRQ